MQFGTPTRTQPTGLGSPPSSLTPIAGKASTAARNVKQKINDVPSGIVTRSQTKSQRPIIAQAQNKITQQYEMITIDDSSKCNKNRFKSIVENASAISKSLVKSVKSEIIGTKKVILPGNVEIIIQPTDEMLLYTQDMNYVAEMMKNVLKSDRFISTSNILSRKEKIV